MNKRFLLLISFVSILLSCQNKQKQETYVDEYALNYEKVEAFSHAASKAKETELNLDFGFKFGMSRKEVKRVLARLSPEKTETDIYYTVDIQKTNYGVSIEPKYKNEKLYSLEISFLTKGHDEEISSSDFNEIWNYYTNSFFKNRGFKTFIFSTELRETICVAQKDNLLCEMKSVGKGVANIIELSFENKAAGRGYKNSAFVGTYCCARTHDTYHFNDDGTGYFKIQGGVSVSTFKWVRRGTNVTITYTGDDAGFGKQYLEYAEEHKLLTEESESFGTLLFFKMGD